MLRELFGPSREDIWRQLCAETGASFVDGGFWKGDKVQATHEEWTVTLDIHVVSTGKTAMHYTRMRAPYVNPDGFRFNIYRAGLFSEIGKMLGMQDAEVGYEEFDRDFVIKGNDDAKLRMLFANAKLRELISAQPQLHFAVKDDDGCFFGSFPEGVDELYFRIHGVIKDVERLKLLFDLFAETLDELCRMGSAYKDAPQLGG